MKHPLLRAATVAFLLCTGLRVEAATRTVGPGKTYAKPCAAIAAAQAGDVIEVDAAGSYDGDNCSWSTDNLTVRGVGGRARIDAGKNIANVSAGKGIFVISAPNATIENFELVGAVAGASANGSGIRHQGTNLVVRNCYFHDDEDGILGSPAVDGTGTVLIEATELANNGHGDGLSHNLYLGPYAKFTIHNSYSHGAKVGHLLKSRALENDILYNRLTDEGGTTASYEINLPNAGLSFVIGNLIEQSAASGNPAIIDYASEPAGNNPDLRLFVVNNTIVNDKASGTFVQTTVTVPAVLMNNIFTGGGTITNQGNAVLTTNFTMGDPRLVAPATYDYHLAAGSPCADQGTMPPSVDGHSLVPMREYGHPLTSKVRTSVGTIDIGAYELGNPGGPEGDAGAEGGASSSSSGGTSGSSGGTSGAPGSDGGSGAAPGDDSSSSGCGCHVVATRSSGLAALVGVTLAAAALLTKRRRRP